MAQKGLNQRISQLEKSVKRLEQLICDSPEEHHRNSVEQHVNSSQTAPWWRWSWSALTKLPWSEILSKSGIAAGIAIAFLTYLQWHDLRHNFMVDQRSWLKIGTLWPELKSDTPAVITGELSNIGKSVITGLYGETAFEIVDAADAPSFSLEKRHNFTSMNPVFPTDSHKFPIELWDRKRKTQRPFTPTEIQQLKSGQTYIATFGMFFYSDQFGKHWYRFCQWHSYNEGVQGSFNAAPCVNWNAGGDGRANVPFSLP
jgi:hypothetical protein